MRHAPRWLVYPPCAMLTIGCAGFPVPATRFFKELLFVEIQDTHVAVPGMGSLRRWRKEAPPGFEFALLGPREIGQEGFRVGKIVETALKTIEGVAKELNATTAVFVAPADFASNKNNKAAVREFLTMARGHFQRIVWEAPSTWNANDAEAIAKDAGVIAARDPLTQGLSRADHAYYRLPGPAGHKSRYEDPAIEKLAELASEAKHSEVHYVFTNVDMFADAKRLKKALKL